MSIPKEPRQLMINLMYLVLTALLALNVSAEVMNAFFSLDKGLAGSREIVTKNNDQLQQSVEKAAKDYPSAESTKWNDRAKEANRIANDFTSYIESVRTELFEKAGGPNPKVEGQPKDIRNKDLTTRWFIKEGKGAEIEATVREARTALSALVDNDATQVAQLTLDIEPLPGGVKAKDWPEYKFKQMPVAAVFPLLGKMQSDAKSSATAVLNFCANKVQGTDMKFDKFLAGLNADKSYVIRGEKYSAEVFLSAFSSKADNVNVSVNGRSIPLKDGVGKFEETTSSTGEKTVKVTINLKNPATGKVETVTKDYKYEVGERSCSVQLDKMNVFYIGVDNPISVSAAGVSSNDLKVNFSGVSGNANGKGKYIVRASSPGEATITLSGGGLAATTFNYKVKRIPNPVPKLGAQHISKAMGNGEFKAQTGIAAVLENFDFDAKCDMVGFKMAYIAKRQDPVEKTNSGARFGGDVQDLVNKAKPGDVYYFDEIRAKCPGDAASRELGGLVFKIK